MAAEEEPPKGLNLKICHSVAVGGAPTDGPVLRSALSPHTLHERPFGTNFQNIYSIFEAAAARRPSRPCFGTRFRADGSVGPFSWQTYEEVAARVQAFAAGLWQLHVVPASADGKRFVGLYMKNSPEWMVAAEACYRTGVCIVPMYDTLGPDTVGYIQRQTGMGTAICSANELPTLLKACPFADVIVAGPVAPALLAKCRAARIPVRTFSEVEAAGQAALPILASLPQPGPKDLALLCYTSGTTGDPKGAMLSHGNILAALSIQGFPGLPLLGADPEVQEIHLSYLPLAHIYETVVLNGVLFHAGAVGFYQGDTLKIVEDLQALRPTVFSSVPRLYNRIYDKIVGGAQAKGLIARSLFARALSTKLDALRTTGAIEHGLWDKLVFSKVAAQLGLDRCRVMFSGSAPISDSVKDFMRVAFSVVFLEGYGMTESAAGGTLSHPDDFSNGHVGNPSLSTEVKLQDVAEMGYVSSELPPRGEVCMRGPTVFMGYYKMEEKTKETIDDDGWLHTGDIGRWNADGTLSIIDRKKNIFKLAQGEYVAAEKIENVCARCPLVAQCFVYGDSLQSYLVMIVVPDGEEVAKFAGHAPPTGAADYAGVAKVLGGAAAPKLAAAVRSQVVEAAKAAKLHGFEIPKKIHLSAEPWTADNGLLTPTFKLKRNDAKKRFQAEIDKMYAEGVPAGASKL